MPTSSIRFWKARASFPPPGSGRLLRRTRHIREPGRDGKPHLLRRECDAHQVNSTALCSKFREATPTAADIQDRLARAKIQFSAYEIKFPFACLVKRPR